MKSRTGSSKIILYRKLGLDETPKNPVVDSSEIVISEYNFGFNPSTSLLPCLVVAGAATLIVVGAIVCICLIPETGGASAALIIPLEQVAAKVIEFSVSAAA